jgi:integrase
MAVHIRKRTTQSGERRYQVRFRRGGRYFPLEHGGSFRHAKEARERADLLTSWLAAGKDPSDELAALNAPTERLSFRQWAERYKRSRVDLADHTALDAHLLRLNAKFGGSDPFALTVADWQEWISENVKSEQNPKGLKPSSLLNYLTTGRLLLDFAGVEPNPARDNRVKLPKADHEEVNPPTAKQFLAILDNTASRWRLALVTMEQTGMAVGETCRLGWGDVDVAEAKFRLRRSTVKGQIGARARWVQVPRWLMDAIEDSCPFDDRTPERPVFGGTPNGYQGAMVRACKAASIPAFTPHDLRHRRLSLWHGQGIPAARLAERAGHSKPSMSLDVYSHVLLDPAEATESELSALLRA